MSRPVPVLINRGGGTAKARGEALHVEVASAFAAAGMAIDLRLLDGSEIARAARGLSDHPIVVVGGGDGTLGGAAQALVDGGGASLGILPLGTRNHLALELGIPVDLPAAARAIAAGATRRIDLGRVNGIGFVNNASIGFYPQIVRERDGIALPKKLAALPATARALGRIRHHRLRLELPGEEGSEGGRRIVTPMLFVGNNRYTLDRGHLGEREALDDGVLSIYAVASRRRLALIGFALRALIGRVDPARDFAALGDAAAFTVSGRSRAIDIAIDGEVTRMAMPLRFAIDPLALTVIVPTRPEVEAIAASA